MKSSKYYLVIDLEATCDDTGSIPREQTEIIEIGAVLVDAETLAPQEEWTDVHPPTSSSSPDTVLHTSDVDCPRAGRWSAVLSARDRRSRSLPGRATRSSVHGVITTATSSIREGNS
jgi:hypothetical protein